MGDPAEENDPPPESRRFLTNDLQSVNWKNEKTENQTIFAQKTSYRVRRLALGPGDFLDRATLISWISLPRDCSRVAGNRGIPMAKSIFRQRGVFRIDQVNRVLRAGPGVEEIPAREYFAHMLGGARIVDDRIAVLGEPYQNDQMAIGPWSFGA